MAERIATSTYNAISCMPRTCCNIIGGYAAQRPHKWFRDGSPSTIIQSSSVGGQLTTTLPINACGCGCSNWFYSSTNLDTGDIEFDVAIVTDGRQQKLVCGIAFNNLPSEPIEHELVWTSSTNYRLFFRIDTAINRIVFRSNGPDDDGRSSSSIAQRPSIQKNIGNASLFIRIEGQPTVVVRSGPATDWPADAVDIAL